MPNIPTILVTGAGGQLGSEIHEASTDFPGYEFVFADRKKLSIEDAEAVSNFFEEHKPDFCINTAAYTAVDKAESESEAAFKINAEAAGNLAEICSSYNTKLVHISTDYVFNGETNDPYTERSSTNPLNEYGASKLKGEELVMAALEDAIIIRSSWIYSAYGSNFVKTMIRLMNEKEEINVVNDQYGSPTYAADLAKAILFIINFSEWKPGLYHYCNDGIISWYDFAVEIRNETGSKCKVHPITTSEYPTPARRPAYTAMNTSKIQSAFGLTIHPWKASLQACLARIATLK